MAITSFKRYEKKYMITAKQFQILMPKLKQFMLEDEHSKEGGQYNIYNIYYDNEHHDVIKHSISKPYYKEKLRLRSYQILTSKDQKVFLELKKKIDGIVNKRRVVMTLAESEAYLEQGIRPDVHDYMSEQVLNEIDYYLSRQTLEAKVYVAYKRIALFGKEDRSIRVTFDFDIITRRDNLTLEGPQIGKPLLEEGMYLMEVKISDSLPLWLTGILTELSIYHSSFSKYGNEYQNYIRELNKEKRGVEVCYNPSYRQREILSPSLMR